MNQCCVGFRTTLFNVTHNTTTTIIKFRMNNSYIDIQYNCMVHSMSERVSDIGKDISESTWNIFKTGWLTARSPLLFIFHLNIQKPLCYFMVLQPSWKFRVHLRENQMETKQTIQTFFYVCENSNQCSKTEVEEFGRHGSQVMFSDIFLFPFETLISIN